MKRQLGFVLVLVLLGVAQTQAGVFSPVRKSEAPPSCRSDASTPLSLRSGSTVKATCSAYCAGGFFMPVGCSGSCTAVDVNCPHGNGYVICNGSTFIPCPSSCPVTNDYCEVVNGTSCTSGTRSCTGSDGLQYTCNCRQGNWICPL